MNLGNTSNRARIFLAALVLILGAFWAGARFGPHGPSKVEAVPLRSSGLSQVAARDSGLTEDESINVRIYRQASPAVANILTKARSEEHTSELQSRLHLVCRLLLEKKKPREQVEPLRYLK